MFLWIIWALKWYAEIQPRVNYFRILNAKNKLIFIKCFVGNGQLNELASSFSRVDPTWFFLWGHINNEVVNKIGYFSILLYGKNHTAKTLANLLSHLLLSPFRPKIISSSSLIFTCRTPTGRARCLRNVMGNTETMKGAIPAEQNPLF